MTLRDDDAAPLPHPLPPPLHSPLHSPLRDPARMLADVRSQWHGQGLHADLWVFGYASLIWRPEFDACEHRAAVVRGWHRAFKMRSRVNRGSPETPGLVYALVSGGMCRGMVYRIAKEQAAQELDKLWHREMPNGVYDPRWLRCATPSGEVLALGFTLSRRSPNFTGRIDDHEMIDILRQARGRYGSTLDYLVRTAEALREHRMCDRESERLLALARRQGLL